MREKLGKGRLLIMACLGMVACAPQAERTLSYRGLGGVELGMTLREAEPILGANLTLLKDAFYQSDSCWYSRRSDGEESFVAYMMDKNRIVRIDVLDLSGDQNTTDVVSDKGVGIGALEKDVIALYGADIEIRPHLYVSPGGHYLRVQSPDGSSALLFETEDGKVTSFRAGLIPQVDYKERCS